MCLPRLAQNYPLCAPSSFQF
uniref:Uncharacterized protein n=1 Tax=Arundo donax TaxID=35708 RepID=A0A0A9C0H8_ARUDO